MQAYRTEYSSSESYSSSTGGGHEIGAASMMSLFGGSGGGMTQAQKYRYNQAPAPAQAQAYYSNYGTGNYGMNRTSRYGEYGQTYNSGGSGGGHVVPFGGSGGHVVPYGGGGGGSDHMNYNQNYMPPANTHYGGGYGGGQYHSNHQQHHAAGGGLTNYNGLNGQRMRHHKRSEKKMFHKMEAMSVSGRNYSTRSIDDDDEYYSSDGDGSCSDGEHYDSDSDYEGGHRRNHNRPIY